MSNSVGLVAAIRGPVILITLGTLIAVDHSGGMSFSRTWPILIIMFGVLKLAEYMKGGQVQ
jgi:hypothetical protein